MISLGDPRTSNPVLCALRIKPEDKIISIRENSNADSNFILTHLIKQILFEKNRFCLVSFHNSLEHYQFIGKKLGYDLQKALDADEVRIIEPIREIVENIGLEEYYLQEDKENLIKCLYSDIKKKLDELQLDDDRHTYLIIDDLSHLFDLGVDVQLVVNFTNYCVNLINDSVNVVINSHVSSKVDEIASNNLQYIADIHVEISPLKTGASNDVTGLMTIERPSSNKSQYHFKAFDRGIKTFHPGESIYHLYK